MILSTFDTTFASLSDTTSPPFVLIESKAAGEFAVDHARTNFPVSASMPYAVPAVAFVSALESVHYTSPRHSIV